MMKKHRIFSLVLALCLAVSLFAACGGGADASSASAAGESQGSSSQAGASAATDEKVELVYMTNQNPDSGPEGRDEVQPDATPGSEAHASGPGPHGSG